MLSRHLSYQHIKLRFEDLQFETICFSARFLNLNSPHFGWIALHCGGLVLGPEEYLAVSLMSTH